MAAARTRPRHSWRSRASGASTSTSRRWRASARGSGPMCPLAWRRHGARQRPWRRHHALARTASNGGRPGEAFVRSVDPEGLWLVRFDGAARTNAAAGARLRGGRPGRNSTKRSRGAGHSTSPCHRTTHPNVRGLGAEHAAMSGSGSAVFGLFSDQHRARTALGTLTARGWQAWLTSTLTRASVARQRDRLLRATTGLAGRRRRRKD